MRQVACTLASGFLFLGSLIFVVFCEKLVGHAMSRYAWLWTLALLLMIFSIIPLIAGTLRWYREHLYSTPWPDENKKERKNDD